MDLLREDPEDMLWLVADGLMDGKRYHVGLMKQSSNTQHGRGAVAKNNVAQCGNLRKGSEL